LGNIILRTQPVSEDTDIRIRATKTFDPSENRATQTDLLDAILPLKVRANPALSVSVEPSPIIDFKGAATIKIAGTQRSAKYQLYIRPIPDRDFVHQAASEGDVITIGVEREPDVHIRKPARQAVWIPPEGYAKWGDAQAGIGGELLFTIDGLADDSLIIVQAEKAHEVSQDGQTFQTVSSALQLEQAAVALVRPNPAQPLRVKVLMEGNETNGELQVFDGQPGVFYHFRLAPEVKEISQPRRGGMSIETMSKNHPKPRRGDMFFYPHISPLRGLEQQANRLL